MKKVNRRRFLSTTAAAGPGLLLRPGAQAGRAASNGRPRNVLILMSDQHRPYAMGFRGDTVAHTPNLDAFAGTALCFERAYCSDPVCASSRASMLTGLYSHHHGVYTNTYPWPFEHKTTGEYFGRAGYMTGIVGKMHFVDGQRHGFAYNLDFNEWFQYLGPKTKIYADELGAPDDGSGQPQVESEWKAVRDPWAPVRTPDGRQGYNHPGRVSLLPEEDHFESFVARESIRFLTDHGTRQPFLLIASFLKPHNPHMPSERFFRMYRPEDMKLSDTWGKVDLAKVPQEIVHRIKSPTACPELLDPKWAKVRMACYYDCIAQMDEQLGTVLAALRQLGLEDNTIVVYLSDHGEMLSDHGLWEKFVFYGPSLGIPFLIRVPGVTSGGVRSNTPISLVQLLPTLMELCGLEAPAGIDGTSFAASLRDPGHTMENTIFAEFALNSRGAKYLIHDGRFKCSYYTHDMPELYDLRDDPKEMNNLAIQKPYQGKVDELQARLFAWHQPAPGTKGFI